MSETTPHRARGWSWYLGAAALLLAFVAGWWFGRPTADDHGHDADAAVTPAVAEATATTWYTCSMHPQVRTQDPREKCPICAMELIPVPADADDGDADLPVLRVSERSAALMRVQTRPAERRAVTVDVPVFGRVELDERRLRTISAWVGGRIDRLHVDFTGVAVGRGDAMVDLYSPALIAAQEELLQAHRAATGSAAGAADTAGGLARATHEAARRRLVQLGLSEAQVDAVEAAGRVEDHATIVSPIAGVVIERLASQGQFVSVGDPIYRVADLSTLWVNLQVFEHDLSWLRVGQPAVFTAEALPGETFEGEVAFIDPILDDRSRTVRVRVDVPNPEGRLRPGMFVRGQLRGEVDADDAGQPLVIPASAALLTGRRAVVYVQDPAADRPTFEGRTVTLGPRAGDWYVVRDGLAEGELVVTQGNFKIDSELQIRGRPSMMQPRPPREPSPAERYEVTRPTADEIAAYPLDTCVVTDLPLDSMGGPVKIEHDGRVVLFCCDGCLPAFAADPEAYLRKLEAGGGG
jgi:Cu(I)/Ag(I) efflux system membrane fusion protein